MQQVKQRTSQGHSAQTKDSQSLLSQQINNAWSKIAPSWPLRNLIAVNPLAGFEDLPFEEALKQAQSYFQQPFLPEKMLAVNVQSIKWLQQFFDQGQSTIKMPLRQQGFLSSVLGLLRFDRALALQAKQKHAWLDSLPQSSEAIIMACLTQLKIKTNDHEQFLVLLLTTLPGWAAYVKYRTDWADATDAQNPNHVDKKQYLAFRLVLTCLIWPQAKELLTWHAEALKTADVTAMVNEVAHNETRFTDELLSKINFTASAKSVTRPNAQLVFCIDVRSEPFRRALESYGHYETFGFAGFFGVPIAIHDAITDEVYHSCPVLIKPTHQISEKLDGCTSMRMSSQHRLRTLKKLYQSVKYTFTTPFSLVETVGIVSGLWMSLKNIAPRLAQTIKTKLRSVFESEYERSPDINSISFEQQVAFATNALTIMGLTQSFAQVVVLCGHGSTTENNAYASSLDCGACGGRHGGSNARILAKILNTAAVRQAVQQYGITIPDDTHFIGAEHNTTTDEVMLFAAEIPESVKTTMTVLRQDLQSAQEQNSQWRLRKMALATQAGPAKQQTLRQAKDWAQVRPEWGLAKNAAFIIGPRSLTQGIDLDGRAFLHSYQWDQDPEGSSLNTIMTAPMIVAQWINAQYLFSTLDNIAYGAGSKVTQNVTGKIGVMQGNASDLMHGLALQSVYKTDTEPYHLASRLSVVVYAPRSAIDSVINQNAILQKLFGNSWLHLICFDPRQQQCFRLQRNLAWEKMTPILC